MSKLHVPKAILDINGPYGPLIQGGVTLTRNRHLLVSTYAFQEFTKEKIPERVDLNWDQKRGVIIITPGTDRAFVPPMNIGRKAVHRIRILGIFNANNIEWPEKLLKTGQFYLPFTAVPGRIEVFYRRFFELHVLHGGA